MWSLFIYSSWAVFVIVGAPPTTDCRYDFVGQLVDTVVRQQVELNRQQVELTEAVNKTEKLEAKVGQLAEAVNKIAKLEEKMGQLVEAVNKTEKLEEKVGHLEQKVAQLEAQLFTNRPDNCKSHF